MRSRSNGHTAAKSAVAEGAAVVGGVLWFGDVGICCQYCATLDFVRLTVASRREMLSGEVASGSDLAHEDPRDNADACSLVTCTIAY